MEDFLQVVLAVEPANNVDFHLSSSIRRSGKLWPENTLDDLRCSMQWCYMSTYGPYGVWNGIKWKTPEDTRILGHGSQLEFMNEPTIQIFYTFFRGIIFCKVCINLHLNQNHMQNSIERRFARLIWLRCLLGRATLHCPQVKSRSHTI